MFGIFHDALNISIFHNCPAVVVFTADTEDDQQIWKNFCLETVYGKSCLVATIVIVKGVIMVSE